MAKQIDAKKLENKIDRLEGKFDSFLVNHFAHLASDVTTLIQENNKQHGEMQQSMDKMEKNILKGIKT